MSDSRRMLIIISAARSGSKFLRDLLGASRQCAVVPYDINYVWRHGNESASDDALLPESVDERQIAYIRKVIPRLAGVRRASDQRLVIEKTVSNALRVPFVARIFPDAKFVHLIRDGRAVAESTRRVWNELPASAYMLDKLRYFPMRNYHYALWYLRNHLRLGGGRSSRAVWGPRYPGIASDLESMNLLAVCARQWSQCLQFAEIELASLPHEQVYTVRYEDLVDGADPLAELCEFAGIDEVEPIHAAWAARIEVLNRDKWRQGLTDAELLTLENQIGRQLRNKGYSR